MSVKSSQRSRDPAMRIPGGSISEGNPLSSSYPQRVHISQAKYFENVPMSSDTAQVSNVDSRSEPTMPQAYNYQFSDSSLMAHNTHDFPDSSSQSFDASNYGSLLDDQDFMASLVNYQPCDDCTPATKTTIPHHHHTSGRLPGASATLDGHFCCSWLVLGEPCFLCFESAEALDNHIKNDHAGKDGTYRCLWQNCSKHNGSNAKSADGMNFGNKPKLMRHVHSHTGYKPFACTFPDCGRAFVTKEQLKNHETTHTKARNYKCEHCGRAFAVKSALTTHITAVHEGNKTHRCEVCGKAFADSSNLSKHRQTHFKTGSGGVRKQRAAKRAASISAGSIEDASSRSTPSVSTPSIEPVTPTLQFNDLREAPGAMAPPTSIPSKYFFPHAPVTSATSYGRIDSTTAPNGEIFDPNCICCEKGCTPPEGPPTPCEEADDCDLEGFCDMPDCLEQCDLPDCPEASASAPTSFYEPRSCDVPQGPWDDFMMDGTELEESFNSMHGSL